MATVAVLITAILVFQRLIIINGGQSMTDSETVTQTVSMSESMSDMSMTVSMIDTISVSEAPSTSTAAINSTATVTDVPQMTTNATVETPNVTATATTEAPSTSTAAINSTATLTEVPQMTTNATVETPNVTPTATTSTPTSSAFVPATGDGPEVLITVTIIAECNQLTLVNKTDPTYQSLKNSLTNSLFVVYKNCSLKAIVLVSFTCIDNNAKVDALVNITFGASFPSDVYIKPKLEDAILISEGKLGSLLVNKTVTVSFIGVTLSYEPVDDQCQDVCCGAGGPIKLEQKCKPDNKCAGLEPSTKEEDGHCDANDSNAKCKSVECDGSNVLSSLLVLTFASSFLSLLI